MHGSDAQLTASQVLRVFRHDEFYLFLGAAFTTVGLVSAAFAFLGRKVDALLIWLGLFATLYGQRLWLQSGLFSLLVAPSPWFDRLRQSIDYLIPIPALFYFRIAGFTRASRRAIVLPFSILFAGLFLITILYGSHPVFRLVNNVIVIAGLCMLVADSLREQHVDADVRIIRGGLLTFVTFALCDNIAGAFGVFPHVEPIGFACFLGTLGYVAARRSMQRDQQFTAIQKELEIATRIQTAILPPAYARSAYFDVASRYVPMTSVAGDFYDFLVASEDEAGLLIADVSGHGVPAALIASMVKLAATSQQANRADPAALLSGMNTALCGNTQSQFVTAAYVHLHAPSATLRYAAAAHPPMLLLRDGRIFELVENGLMLAAFSFATYSTLTYPLMPGDRIVLYTDGLIEATNAGGEEFGLERLSALLREGASLSPQQSADNIIAATQTWATNQNDDLTLLVCDFGAIRTPSHTELPAHAAPLPNK